MEQGTVAGAQRSITTSSALNPTLVLAGIVTPASLLVSQWAEGWPYVALLTLAIAPIVLAIWQIARFTILDPDRLQNEKHVEAKMAISRLGVMVDGKPREVVIDNTTLEQNPALEGDAK